MNNFDSDHGWLKARVSQMAHGHLLSRPMFFMYEVWMLARTLREENKERLCFNGSLKLRSS